MKMLVVLFTFVFACSLVGETRSQDAPPPDRGFGQGRGQGPGRFQIPTFEELDKNKDGKISRDEFPFPAQFFDRLDTDHDGFLSKAELDAATQGFGRGGPRQPGGGMGQALERLLDKNGDGKVSKEEFARIVDVFEKLDADHDGSLSAEELGALPRLAQQQQADRAAATASTSGVDVDRFMAQFDANKDGKLSADELKAQPKLMALDTDKDGYVSRQELEVFLKARAQAQSAQKPTTTPDPKKP